MGCRHCAMDNIVDSSMTSLTSFAAESVCGSAINLHTTVVTGVGVAKGDPRRRPTEHEWCCCPCAVPKMKQEGHSAMHQTLLLRLPKGGSVTQHLGPASGGSRPWQKL